MKEMTNAGRYHGLLIKKRKGKRGITFQTKARKNGKPVTLSAKTKEELKAKIDALDDTTGDPITLAEAWELYISDRRKAAQPNTLTGYISKYSSQLHKMGAVRMSGFSEKDITEFIGMLKAEGYSSRSINDYMICLFAFVKWARQQGFTDRSFSISDFGAVIPHPSKKAISIYSDDDFARFLAVVRNPRYKTGQRRHIEQIVLCYSVMFYAGLRISEALALKGENVYNTDGQQVIEVTQKAEKIRSEKGKYVQNISQVLKSAAAHRIIPISEELFSALREMSRSDDDLILDTLSIVSFTGTDAAIKKRAKKEGLKVITCHEMRKSCLTRWAESGMPPMVLKTLAGHTSIAVTEKYYIKSDLNKAARTAAEYMPLKQK